MEYEIILVQPGKDPTEKDWENCYNYTHPFIYKNLAIEAFCRDNPLLWNFIPGEITSQFFAIRKKGEDSYNIFKIEVHWKPEFHAQIIIF